MNQAAAALQNPAQHPARLITRCPVCSSSMRQAERPYLFRCDACEFLASNLPVVIDESGGLDEAAREAGLEELRRRNFTKVAACMEAAGLRAGARVLEVGCGHGWFLDEIKGRGLRAEGLEPDPLIARVASERHAVRIAFFPEGVEESAYDALVFNDVFEHLPDVNEAMRSCRRALRTGGLLVLNLPVRTGLFYQLAASFAAFGMTGPLDRLWQKDFPSPHLSYFRADNLARLAEQHDFQRVVATHLPSLSLNGLWSRLRYGAKTNIAADALVWLGLVVSLPLLRLAPKDIGLFVFAAPRQ